MHRYGAFVLGPLCGGMILLATAGCTMQAQVSEAGFAEPRVDLTLGIADLPGRYSYDLAEEFARRVAEDTSRTVGVTVTQLEDHPRRWNQVLATKAQQGEYDLALVQAQAWDALEVTSLTALYVPFLVTDEEVLDAVVTGDVADDLLAGLDGTGVTGLALLPGGLRHLFAEDAAPTQPEDLAGQGVRAAYSTTIYALLEAAGARPDDPNGDELDAQLRNGDITVLDSTFQLADGLLSAPAAAGDVVIYPLAFTLVAHDDALDTLSPGQRARVQQAAVDTAAWAAQTRPTNAQAARALCERSSGARVVLAGEEAVNSWHGVTRSLAESLRADPDVDAVARQIEQVVDAVVAPGEPVEPCGHRDSDAPDQATPEPTANVPAEFPEGTYRKEVTAEELMEGGVDVTHALSHAGVWTLLLRDGVFDDDDCPGGTYDFVEGRIVLRFGSGPECGALAGLVLFSGGWQLDGTSMTFTDVRSGHGSDTLIRALFGGAPWTKID